jgi:hypothetical protein
VGTCHTYTTGEVSSVSPKLGVASGEKYLKLSISDESSTSLEPWLCLRANLTVDFFRWLTDWEHEVSLCIKIKLEGISHLLSKFRLICARKTFMSIIFIRKFISPWISSYPWIFSSCFARCVNLQYQRDRSQLKDILMWCAVGNSVVFTAARLGVSSLVANPTPLALQCKLNINNYSQSVVPWHTHCVQKGHFLVRCTLQVFSHVVCSTAARTHAHALSLSLTHTHTHTHTHNSQNLYYLLHCSSTTKPTTPHFFLFQFSEFSQFIKFICTFLSSHPYINWWCFFFRG